MFSDEFAILMVDDDAVDVEHVTRLLSKIPGESFRIEHAETADACFERLAVENFDCLILDYRLGSEDGLFILEEIRKAGHNMPVIAMSGFGAESLAVAAIKRGAQDYLSKGGMTSATLHSSIKSAVEAVRVDTEVRKDNGDIAMLVDMSVRDMNSQIDEIIRDSSQFRKNHSDIASSVSQHVDRTEAVALRLRNYLEKLTDDVQYSVGEVTFNDVPLDDVIEAAKLHLADLIDSRNAVISSSQLPVVRGDFVALRTLFQNLISNAVKFNESEVPLVTITPTFGDGVCLVSVRDDGIGIPIESQHSIFVRFTQLHDRERYDGSGLGLATAQRIAIGHGSRIRVESSSEAGSCFSITFRAN